MNFLKTLKEKLTIRRRDVATTSQLPSLSSENAAASPDAAAAPRQEAATTHTG